MIYYGKDYTSCYVCSNDQFFFKGGYRIIPSSFIDQYKISNETHKVSKEISMELLETVYWYLKIRLNKTWKRFYF